MFIMFGLYYLCKKRKKPTKSIQKNQSEQLLAGFRYSGCWLWLKYSLLRFLMQYSLLHSNWIKHKYGSCTSRPTRYHLCYEKASLTSAASKEDLERQGDQLNNVLARLVPKVTARRAKQPNLRCTPKRRCYPDLVSAGVSSTDAVPAAFRSTHGLAPAPRTRVLGRHLLKSTRLNRSAVKANQWNVGNCLPCGSLLPRCENLARGSTPLEQIQRKFTTIRRGDGLLAHEMICREQRMRLNCSCA